MAQPPPAAPAGVAVSERDVLLATKLHVPRLQAAFVARSRLARALDEALVRPLILVCAPAGFGKTALLADWVRSGHHPVGWLSLDPGDNDPARFWRHAVAALDQAHPGIAERAGPLLGPTAPSSFDGLVTALINELAARPGQDELLLVLDDYHLIDTPQVHKPLTFLLEHLPPGLRVILASRSDPPLPLARLRAAGQLAELRTEDLRFTADEAAILLREAIGAGLPDAAVAALETRTEGWAAGLQLAALSLRGQADPAGFVEAFSGSHRYVLDYLGQEVLDRQEAGLRGFLLETSVLERLNGALCDAVTGRTGSQAVLEEIERSGLFLVPLDEVRGWWRYHHLFADLLRARLRRERPGQVTALHRNAAAWCQEHGLADDAVRHALGAGDAAWAARLIERHADELLFRGEGATVDRWVAALPAGLAGSRPRLLLAQSRMALLSGRLPEAGDLLDAAEHAHGRTAGPADESYEPSDGRVASLLANVPATIALDRAYLAELHGDAEQAITYASRALAQAGEDEWMLASHARGYLSIAEWMSGRLGKAERLLASVIAQWRAAGEHGLAVRGCHHLGQIQRAQGLLDAALSTYQQAVDPVPVHGRPRAGAGGIGNVGMAEVAYQRDQLDDALRHVTEGIPLARRFPYTQPLAAGLATLAWIRQAQGDEAGALEAMDEAAQAAPGPAVAGLLNPVPAQRARLLLAQGDTAAAFRWAEDNCPNPAAPPYSREPEYLVLARVLLAQDRPAQALTLLDNLRAAAASQGRTGSIIEIQALRALALAAGGERATAVDALADALTLACPQGYVRVFADEGAPMETLLGWLVAAQRDGESAAGSVELGYLARLLRASGGTTAAAGAGRSAVTVPGLVEPLTARELEVLRLLAAGTTNQAIAAELVVSLDTAKKHVSHVLGKLGAANRTEAVTRARQLGLIG
jgi:LuxR family maltose regulon positive regulatory protein